MLSWISNEIVMMPQISSWFKLSSWFIVSSDPRTGHTYLPRPLTSVCSVYNHMCRLALSFAYLESARASGALCMLGKRYPVHSGQLSYPEPYFSALVNSSPLSNRTRLLPCLAILLWTASRCRYGHMTCCYHIEIGFIFLNIYLISTHFA